MLKLKFILFSLFLNFYLISSDKSNIQIIEQTETVKVSNEKVEDFEFEDIDNMFKSEDTVVAPEFKEPSKIIIFIRKYGIAFLHKYYNFRDWFYIRLKSIFAKDGEKNNETIQ